MSRKPDTPCAGGCGRMLWSGRGSLPDGVRSCRECRAAKRNPVPAKPRSVGEFRKCDVAGCSAQHLAQGMCRKHYYQARRAAGLEQTNPIIVLASTVGPVRCRVTVGVMTYCPKCRAVMLASSPIARSCCIDLELNAEEVSWVIYGKYSIRQSTRAA